VGEGRAGRPSTARMTLWCPDLEVGAAYQLDLAGGGGNFGRLSVAGRRAAADGEVWSGVSASGGLLGSAACLCLRRRLCPSEVVDGQAWRFPYRRWWCVAGGSFGSWRLGG
jgi:hypothetical protein